MTVLVEAGKRKLTECYFSNIVFAECWKKTMLGIELLPFEISISIKKLLKRIGGIEKGFHILGHFFTAQSIIHSRTKILVLDGANDVEIIADSG